jgi:hypothetical protein
MKGTGKSDDDWRRSNEVQPAPTLVLIKSPTDKRGSGFAYRRVMTSALWAMISIGSLLLIRTLGIRPALPED